MDLPQSIRSMSFPKINTMISKIAKNYTIFIDSSFMMTDEAEEFFEKDLVPVLKKINKGIDNPKNFKKIILAERVLIELQKQSKLNNKIKTDAQVAKAQKGLEIISSLTKAECLRLLGQDGDTYADNLFVAKFTENRLDMKLCLLTQDNALGEEIIRLNTSLSSGTDKKGKDRIKGIKAFKFNGSGQIEEFKTVKVSKHNLKNLKKPYNPFSDSADLIDISQSKIISPEKIPSTGEKVFNELGDAFELGAKVGDGAEGIVYSIDDLNVCKIYKEKKLTNLGLEKLKLMTERQVIHEAICWPNDIIYNDDKKAIGYKMKKADGVELHKRLFFGPKLIETRLPTWTKLDLVKVCLNILEAIKILHNHNVLVGDLNGRNIMVFEDCSIYIVDTDSFQLEGYPCPMGQITFTPPEIQKKEFKNFLRTIEHENFAIATLIFMILMPGKPPYSKQDGGMITDNIRKGVFSYPFNKSLPKDPPKGPWRYMWSHLPYDTKELFFKTFSEGERIGASLWIGVLEGYSHGLRKKYHSSEIKPDDYKTVPPDRKKIYNLD